MTTIVSLHAHPDDEALLTGGWLSQRARAGDRVVVAFATDGAAGLATRSVSGPRLGDLRRAEAERAAGRLGVARVVWLGYADSGMRTAPTRVPHRFVDVPAEEAARRVAAILDEERATVLTGYDDNGGYGHPDHVQVHRVARLAQSLAARRPALLEATIDRTCLVRLLRWIGPAARLLPGITVPGSDIFSDPADVTATVDVRDALPAKLGALAAHASQATGGIRTIAILRRLPPPLARRVLGTEWFREVP
jgi:LmbE family N-acetylglucosaminyl deacetylase